MAIVLVSISILFLAASVAVLITATQAPLSANAAERAGLLWGLLASTLLILAIGGALQHALHCVRQNRRVSSARALRWSGGLALTFLWLQAMNCYGLLAMEATTGGERLYLFSVCLLVGLHAAHILGGLIPLWLTHERVNAGDYSSSTHEGLTLCVQYWHYLGVVWVALVLVLLWIGQSL
jgi:heme/copper-type cytochrome/quinol oxidase subunit 3